MITTARDLLTIIDIYLAPGITFQTTLHASSLSSKYMHIFLACAHATNTNSNSSLTSFHKRVITGKMQGATQTYGASLTNANDTP